MRLKLSVIVLFLSILSCKEERIIDSVELYSGINNTVFTSKNQIAFLANIPKYNYMMATIFLSKYGSLEKIYPIDRSANVDVSLDYITLSCSNNYIYLIYSEGHNRVVIERFFNNISTIIQELKSRRTVYGSIIQIGDSPTSSYIRSNNNYNSATHKGYIYSYYSLDKNLNILSSGTISLGEFYPQGIIMLDDKIFYYIDDVKMLYRSIDSKKENPIFQFPKDIIEVKKSCNKIVVLLEDSLYIVSNNGVVEKSLNLIGDRHGFIAKSLVSSGENILQVYLEGPETQIVRTFTLTGVPINEYIVDRRVVGDAITVDNSEIIYSDGEYIYLNSL